MLPNTIALLLDTIETTGNLDQACLVVGISRQTLNKQIRQDDQLKRAIYEAIDSYKENLDLDFSSQSLTFIKNLLSGNVVKTTSFKRYALVKPDSGVDDDDPDDSQASRMVEILKEEREETVLPGRWLLERYLPQVRQQAVEVVVNFSENLTEVPEDDPEAKQILD